MPSPEVPLSFFALLRDKNEEAVRRVRVSADVQQRLTSHFTGALDRFLPDDMERVAFDGRYKPDEQEILYVDPFVVQEVVLQAIADPTSVQDIELTKEAMPPIKAVFTGWVEDGQPRLLLQLFRKNQYLTRSGLSLILSTGTFKELSDPGLVIANEITAFLDGECLFFRSYTQARQIVDLSDCYREATDPDIDAFVAHRQIALEDEGAFRGAADQWVRRKLALVQDRAILDHATPADIVDSAKLYNIELETQEVDGTDALLLPAEKKKLKDALRFLDEDFYQGPLSAAQYLSNSKRKVV